MKYNMGGVVLLSVLFAFIGASLESSVYTFKNVDGVCIYVKMDASFTVKYYCVHNSTDKSVKDCSTCIPLPPANETRISGNCYSNSSSLAHINITFGKEFQHSFDMMFNITDKQWVLSEMCLRYDTSDTDYFINASNPDVFNACHKDVFVVAHDHDYYCQYGERIIINSNVTASFSFIEVYPLGEEQEKHQYCPSDEDHEHAKVVPIVVGSVLGLLLLVIFVVYSIAYLRQRNSSTRFYEPVNSS